MEVSRDAGPLLETLTRRLAECPADFLAEPRIGRSGAVHVEAVVVDLLRDLGGEPLTKEQAALFQSKDARKDRNRLSLTLIACWLLHDEWFRSQKRFAARAHSFLSEGLTELAGLIPAPLPSPSETTAPEAKQSGGGVGGRLRPAPRDEAEL